MSARLSGEKRLHKEYGVECWMKMYVCRRDKASIATISLNNWFTGTYLSLSYWKRPLLSSVLRLMYFKSNNPPPLTTFWERIWVMSSKWELTSGDLMQREMKKIICTDSAERGGTFNSFQETHPEKQLWSQECRQPWCSYRAACHCAPC